MTITAFGAASANTVGHTSTARAIDATALSRLGRSVNAVMLSSTPSRVSRYEPSGLSFIEPASADKLKSQLRDVEEDEEAVEVEDEAEAEADDDSIEESGALEWFDVIHAVTTMVRMKARAIADHFFMFTSEV